MSQTVMFGGIRLVSTTTTMEKVSEMTTTARIANDDFFVYVDNNIATQVIFYGRHEGSITRNDGTVHYNDLTFASREELQQRLFLDLASIFTNVTMSVEQLHLPHNVGVLFVLGGLIPPSKLLEATNTGESVDFPGIELLGRNLTVRVMNRPDTIDLVDANGSKVNVG